MSHKYGFSVQDWEAAKGEMRRAMVDRAKTGGFITYTELCEQVETLPLDPHSHAVAAMLGEIATAEDAAGRGIITAIVVYKSAGLEPGPGFFHIAKELGRDTSDRERFWLEELAAVHRGWSGPWATELSEGVDGRCAQEVRLAQETVEAGGYFEPKDAQDERERTFREIVQRRGQSEFRRLLLDAYLGHCAITSCDAPAALEAAHIVQYVGPKSNHASNGLLLRADVHTLYDLELIGIDPDSLEVGLAASLSGTCYEELRRTVLTVPSDAGLRPNRDALRKRWAAFQGQ